MASNKCTLTPACDKTSAAIKPAGPPPTMATSTDSEEETSGGELGFGKDIKANGGNTRVTGARVWILSK
jgi:hypothetical protein